MKAPKYGAQEPYTSFSLNSIGEVSHLTMIAASALGRKRNNCEEKAEKVHEAEKSNPMHHY